MKDLLYESLVRLGQSLDYDGVARWGERLGGLLWTALRSRRELAAETIARRLDLPAERARELARSSFSHSGRSFLEIFLSRQVDKRFLRDRLTIADPDSYRAVRETSRPVVAATGHFGAWELLSPLVHALMPERRKQIVVRRPKDEALHAVMTRLRTQASLEVVEHRRAALPVLRCLKQGGMTAFLVDHNSSSSEAVFLPFLGAVAAVNMGPALLALRAGALVQPVFLLREGDGYVLHTEPWLDTAELEGTREERIQATALFYTQAVERMVRRRPEQWYWLHRRWKTQPPEGWTYVPPKNMK